MPLIFEKWLKRDRIQANPDRLYLFGDNVARKGIARGAGQASECRGEPNAIGVRTKEAPSMGAWALWTDAQFERCAAMIDEDLERAFEHVRRGGTVVCPEAGLGTDRARLPTNAPRIFEHLRTRVKELKRAGLEYERQRDLVADSPAEPESAPQP